jgi:hypothetical protein
VLWQSEAALLDLLRQLQQLEFTVHTLKVRESTSTGAPLIDSSMLNPFFH